MKVAYLLGPRAVYAGKVSHCTYTFSPWAEVNELDWPQMQLRTIFRGGCCGKPTRVMRVFGTDQEVQEGQVEPQWR